MEVRVSEYRDGIDHLYRVINVDYHACVGATEKAYWLECAQRVFTSVQTLTCRRAKAEDLQRHARCLSAAEHRFAAISTQNLGG